MQTQKLMDLNNLQVVRDFYENHLVRFDKQFDRVINPQVGSVYASPPKKGNSKKTYTSDEAEYVMDVSASAPTTVPLEEQVRLINSTLQSQDQNPLVWSYNINNMDGKGVPLYLEFLASGDYREFLELYRLRLVRKIESINAEISRL